MHDLPLLAAEIARSINEHNLPPPSKTQIAEVLRRRRIALDEAGITSVYTLVCKFLRVTP